MSSLETFTLPTKGTFETKQNQQQFLKCYILLNFSDPPEERKKKYNGIHEEFFVKGELEYSFVFITVVFF